MITELWIENFKAIGHMQKIPFAPITLLLGPNSSGKSSIIQSLLLLKQTFEESEDDLLTSGSLTDVGRYRDFVHKHETGTRSSPGKSVAIGVVTDQQWERSSSGILYRFSGSKLFEEPLLTGITILTGKGRYPAEPSYDLELDPSDQNALKMKSYQSILDDPVLVKQPFGAIWTIGVAKHLLWDIGIAPDEEYDAGDGLDLTDLELEILSNTRYELLVPASVRSADWLRDLDIEETDAGTNDYMFDLDQALREILNLYKKRVKQFTHLANDWQVYMMTAPELCGHPRYLDCADRLPDWENEQRKAFRKGSLSDEQIFLLELSWRTAGPSYKKTKSGERDLRSNPPFLGWDSPPTNARPLTERYHRKRFEALKAFVERTGHSRVPPDHRENNVHLGSWVREVRRVYNEQKRFYADLDGPKKTTMERRTGLSMRSGGAIGEENIAAFEAIECWEWNPRKPGSLDRKLQDMLDEWLSLPGRAQQVRHAEGLIEQVQDTETALLEQLKDLERLLEKADEWLCFIDEDLYEPLYDNYHDTLTVRDLVGPAGLWDAEAGGHRVIQRSMFEAERSGLSIKRKGVWDTGGPGPYTMTGPDQISDQVSGTLDNIHHLGPLRNKPKRFYLPGERLPGDLDQLNANARKKFSNWLRYLGVSHKSVSISGSTSGVRQVRLKQEHKIKPTIQDVGFGIGQVWPIVVEALHGSSILCVEQPEAQLHPKMQARLGDLFIHAAMHKKEPKQLIIETHSEHLLLRLLRRVRETTNGLLPKNSDVPLARILANDISILYVESREANSGNKQSGSWVRRLRINDQGQLLDPFPEGFFQSDLEDRMAGYLKE